MPVTRLETICIDMALDRAAAVAHSDELAILGASIAPQADDETLRCVYKFNIEYFDRIERRLAAVEQILADETVVVDISVDALRHGQSIVEGLFNRLALIRQVLARRNN
jgi:hypothetical protein